MYFFAQKAVKSKFLQSGFSDRESLPYFVVFIGLYSLAFVPNTSTPNIWDYLASAISFALAVLSTLLLYKANGGSDGTQFIQKYVILGWVLALRALIALLPATILLFLLGVGLNLIDLEATGPFDAAVFTTIELLFWAYFYFHFSDLRKRELAEQGAAVNP